MQPPSPLTMKLFFFILITFCWSCSKKENPPAVNPPATENFTLQSATINGISATSTLRGLSLQQAVRLSFSAPVKRTTASAILWNTAIGTAVPYTVNYQNNDSVLLLQPSTNLAPLTRYNLNISSGLSGGLRHRLQNHSAVPSSKTQRL